MDGWMDGRTKIYSIILAFLLFLYSFPPFFNILLQHAFPYSFSVVAYPFLSLSLLSLNLDDDDDNDNVVTPFKFFQQVFFIYIHRWMGLLDFFSFLHSFNLTSIPIHYINISLFFPPLGLFLFQTFLTLR